MAQTPDQTSRLELVQKRFNASDAVHKQYVDRWNHFYRLYRSYRADADRYKWATPNDVWPKVPETVETWGAEMFIPYAFSTVETVLPRLLSAHPQMLIRPLEDGIEENVANMKALIDQQQSQINAELKWQEIGKDGLIFGLGVGKSRWRRETTKQFRQVPRRLPLPGFGPTVRKLEERVLFDDPDLESVDPFDFFWDPAAADIEHCEYVVHRTWRSHAYVLDMLRSEVWSGVEEKDLSEGGGAEGFNKAHDERWKAAGVQRGSGRNDMHEVWEYHDHRDQRVTVVLDQQWIVRDIPNPYWHGELPFQIYRPTIVRGEFVGIGEIEPIQDLQEEMNVLRRQRRDNATLVLQRVGFYAQGLFDEDDIVWAPGAMNAVPTDPSQAVYFPNIGEIPASSYRESDEIAGNINMAAGLSDQVRGMDVTAGTTATSTQLVQAAASARIQNKARLLEAMTIKRFARQWMLLNQQFITEAAQKPVMIEQAPQPGQMTPKYLTRRLGPMELMGDMHIEPEGGSMAPENTAQDRQDAMQLLNACRDNPHIDQRAMWSYFLQKMGVKMGDAWLVPENAVPPQALDIIKSAHPELAELVDFAVQRAQQMDAMGAQQAQGGQQAAPDEQQVAA